MRNIGEDEKRMESREKKWLFPLGSSWIRRESKNKTFSSFPQNWSVQLEQKISLQSPCLSLLHPQPTPWLWANLLPLWLSTNLQLSMKALFLSLILSMPKETQPWSLNFVRIFIVIITLWDILLVVGFVNNISSYRTRLVSALDGSKVWISLLIWKIAFSVLFSFEVLISLDMRK